MNEIIYIKYVSFHINTRQVVFDAFMNNGFTLLEIYGASMLLREKPIININQLLRLYCSEYE